MRMCCLCICVCRGAFYVKVNEYRRQKHGQTLLNLSWDTEWSFKMFWIIVRDWFYDFETYLLYFDLTLSNSDNNIHLYFNHTFWLGFQVIGLFIEVTLLTFYDRLEVVEVVVVAVEDDGDGEGGGYPPQSLNDLFVFPLSKCHKTEQHFQHKVASKQKLFSEVIFFFQNHLFNFQWKFWNFWLFLTKIFQLLRLRQPQAAMRQSLRKKGLPEFLEPKKGPN